MPALRATIAHHIVAGPFVQMIGNTRSIYLFLPLAAVLTLFAAFVVQAAQNTAGYPRLIEMFTTTDFYVTGEAAINRQPDYRQTELRVYELDDLQRIETNLSKDLTANPEQSKHIALQRIQQLDEVDRAQMQQAAVGLAKAMQYGVERYPAIVFDGKVVVYGLTDLNAALDHYLTWRAGARL